MHAKVQGLIQSIKAMSNINKKGHFPQKNALKIFTTPYLNIILKIFRSKQILINFSQEETGSQTWMSFLSRLEPEVCSFLCKL